MDQLFAFRIEDEGIHPTWHLEADVDFDEIIASRPKQHAYLARYGRQSMSEDLPLMELQRRVRLISEIVARENEASKVKEER